MANLYIVVSDMIGYDFDPTEYTEEEARLKALEWWDERTPQMAIFRDEEDL